MEINSQPSNEAPENALSLNVSDDFLLTTINQKIRVFDKFLADNDIKARQDKNRDYYLGKQIDKNEIPKYSLAYMENVIWEAVKRNSSIAISRLPDLIAKPGNDTEESQQTAKSITKIINNEIKKRDNKKVLKLGYQQRKVFMYAVVKCVWNNKKKDYEFINVHPQSVIFDTMAKTNDTDKMLYFGESVKLTVEELIAKFPNKKDEIYKELGWNSGEEEKASNMATPVTISEVWFDEMMPVTSEDGQKKWKQISAVVWKFKELILGKIKNPYYDWEGEDELFVRQEKENPAEPATEEDVFESLFGPMEARKIYRNHFNYPRKPYYLMAYDLFGESPIDVSTDIEQVLYFQDQINKEGQQIYDMNVRSKPKSILSTDQFDKKTAADLDTNNPNQTIMVDGDVRMGHSVIQTPPASRQIYESKNQNRQIAFEILALNATTRGVRESGDETLGARQMMREQDFGVIDDEVDDTINACAEWMAGWALQMIKRFYTKDKMVKIDGRNGEIIFNRLNQDLIEDGMEIEVGASGVDKQKRKSEAFEMARMKLIDPYNFYKDIGATNPEGRTRDLLLSNISPELYLKTIVEAYTPDELVNQLNITPPGTVVPPVPQV